MTATSTAPANSVTLTASAIINGVSTPLGTLNYKVGDQNYRTNFKLVASKPTSIIVTSNGGGTDTEVVP